MSLSTLRIGVCSEEDKLKMLLPTHNSEVVVSSLLHDIVDLDCWIDFTRGYAFLSHLCIRLKS